METFRVQMNNPWEVFAGKALKLSFTNTVSHNPIVLQNIHKGSSTLRAITELYWDIFFYIINPQMMFLCIRW